MKPMGSVNLLRCRTCPWHTDGDDQVAEHVVLWGEGQIEVIDTACVSGALQTTYQHGHMSSAWHDHPAKRCVDITPGLVIQIHGYGPHRIVCTGKPWIAMLTRILNKGAIQQNMFRCFNDVDLDFINAMPRFHALQDESKNLAK